MYNSFNFDQQEVDLQNWYYFSEGFNKEELNKIEKDVATLPYEKATTAGGEVKLRTSQIKWVPQTNNWWW